MEHRIIYQAAGKPQKEKRFSETLNQHSALLTVGFCFMLGLLIGALYFKTNNTTGDFYSSSFQLYYQSLSGSFFSVFIDSLLRVLPYMAALFLSGTCMAGIALAPIIVVVCGVQFGLLSGYVYAHYMLNGIVFHLLMICPWAVILALAVLLSARESVGFSFSIARLAFPGKRTAALDQDFKLYCTRQLFIVLFFVPHNYFHCFSLS